MNASEFRLIEKTPPFKLERIVSADDMSHVAVGEDECHGVLSEPVNNEMTFCEGFVKLSNDTSEPVQQNFVDDNRIWNCGENTDPLLDGVSTLGTFAKRVKGRADAREVTAGAKIPSETLKSSGGEKLKQVPVDVICDDAELRDDLLKSAVNKLEVATDSNESTEPILSKQDNGGSLNNVPGNDEDVGGSLATNATKPLNKKSVYLAKSSGEISDRYDSADDSKNSAEFYRIGARFRRWPDVAEGLNTLIDCMSEDTCTLSGTDYFWSLDQETMDREKRNRALELAGGGASFEVVFLILFLFICYFQQK